MDKNEYTRLLLLQRKREKKILKRRRKNKQFKGPEAVYFKEQKFRIEIDKKIVSSFKSNLFSFLVEENFLNPSPDNISPHFRIVKTFSLSENYEATIKQIREIASSIFPNAGKEITLDFLKCEEVDQSALIFLKIITLELLNDLKDLDQKLAVLKAIVTVNVVQSKTNKVNLSLLLFGFIPETNLAETGATPIDTTGFLKGSKSQKNYLENRKGLIASKIVRYVEKCLSIHNAAIDPNGKNLLEGLIAEVLGNAEDHSPLNTYYINANFCEFHLGNKNEKQVGQLNLSFLNFGYSISDGFEDTKHENISMYEEMEKLFNVVNSKQHGNFTKENLFTLYALQEGISRLKYEDESRGTGTMKFIRSFFNIGDYESKEKGYIPSLNIVSGTTFLNCDNKYKPFCKENRYYISLNDSESLADLPSEKHLRNLQTKFPGTVLSVNIYLNTEHIKSKFDENGTNSN